MYDTKNERNKRIQRRESFTCPVCTRHWAPMSIMQCSTMSGFFFFSFSFLFPKIFMLSTSHYILPLWCNSDPADSSTMSASPCQLDPAIQPFIWEQLQQQQLQLQFLVSSSLVRIGWNCLTIDHSCPPSINLQPTPAEVLSHSPGESVCPCSQVLIYQHCPDSVLLGSVLSPHNNWLHWA